MNHNVPTAPPEREAPPLPQKPTPSHGPQATPPRRSGHGWIWLILLVLAAGVGYYFWSRGNNAPAGATDTGSEGKEGKKGGRGGVPPVVVIRATRGNIGVYDTGIGTVTPIYTVVEKTRVDGQLMNVFYKEGDMVQKGQPLAQIDPRPYQVQLEQAQGQLAHDQALLDNARVDEKRYETLLAQNAIPEQQLATQKALVTQYEGTVKADQGQIDSARLNLTYCDIKADITGRIGLRLVDPGNIVHATDANGLLVITQIEPISVIFTLAEGDLPAVMDKYRANQTLRVDAYNADQSQKLATGTLTTIDNQIDQTTGSVRLRAEFDNKDHRLFPNEFVNARLLVQEKRNVVLLNTAAVQRGTGNQTYVFVVKPDNTVTERKITVGTTEGDDTEITSGLAPGDIVVMTGVDKLTEGTKVTGQFANGQPLGGGGRGGHGAQGVPAPGRTVNVPDTPPGQGAAKGPDSGPGTGYGPKQAGGKSKK